jgi:hypothetical protein
MLNANVVSAHQAAPSTIFPDLNDLLGELVGRVRAILGQNLAGAYLTGSFALGAADLHSDCDFLVVTQEEVIATQEQALRQLHDEIPTRSGHWAHQLEGSYAPRTELQTLESLEKKWLYVDRGWREMQWSTHCNTEDVRWLLRERGLTLAGPPPHELVDEVPGDALRNKMRQSIEDFLPRLLSWGSFDNAWTQRYAVSSLCRMLYTLDTGEVTSKKAALVWAKEVLPSEWHELAQQVLDDRVLGWKPIDPPRPGSVESTIAFAEFAKERAGGR